MPNTLVDPVELEDFPGAPFDDVLVDVAVAAIRAEAGWHIAPLRTETLTVDSYGGVLLLIPSRRIVSVSAVRDVTGTPVVLTSWTRMSGGIYRSIGWPVGTLEVDITHGYASTPEELLPVVVDYVRRASNPRDPFLAGRSVGQVSESYRDGGGGGTSVDPTVARYAVPAGVA